MKACQTSTSIDRIAVDFHCSDTFIEYGDDFCITFEGSVSSLVGNYYHSICILVSTAEKVKKISQENLILYNQIEFATSTLSHHCTLLYSTSYIDTDT